MRTERFDDMSLQAIDILCINTPGQRPERTTLLRYKKHVDDVSQS